MAQPQLLQVKLSRFDAQPWGFRLQGGVDFAAPLLVQKVNGGSLAEKAGLVPGDAVLKINDVDVFNLRHKDAQDIVVRSGNNFVMTIQRGGSTWRPHVTPTGQIPQHNQSPYLQTVTKTSLAHKQQDSQHIGCGYNNSARPFTNGGDGSLKSIVNKQYNTPVGIYSDESIAETLSAQAEVLAGGVLGVNFKKNEKEYQAEKSEVLKFLREEETGQSTPAFNSHQQYQDPQQHQYHQQQQQQPQQQYQQQQQQPQQQYQQQQLQQQYQQQQQQYQQQSSTRHVSAPVNTPKPPSTGGLPTGQNICVECERLITGVFVRIKDKNLHVECFKCATCGTSLKNQGYYNFNNKLYCDIHAKLAAQQSPPTGTEGFVPVPIKPNTKLSATTISAALNAHGYNNGVANGGPSTPTPAPNESSDLPLPPPPSPTQLKQFESDAQDLQSDHKHTGTNSNQSTPSSSLNCIASISSPILVTKSSCGSIGGNVSPPDHLSAPLHSHQGSSLSSSSDLSTSSDLLTGSYSYTATKAPAISLPLPPPPPPPMPLDGAIFKCATPMSVADNKRFNNGVNSMLQEHAAINENDINTQNKTSTQAHNAYNKFLKEYSNKLLTQNFNNNNNSNSNSNNNNNDNKSMETQQNTQDKSNCNNNEIHNSTNDSNKFLKGNSIPKPFPPNSNNILNKSSATSPNVAAITTTLANQLKFQPNQIPSSAIVAPSANFLNNNNSDKQLSSSNSINNMSLATSTLPYETPSIYGQIGDSVDTRTEPRLAAQSVNNDKPFEYVTLTGNVIRSVVPPGKGSNINYRVNQGYVRPFGASPAAPPVAAPKSPISYPPSASNPYATLPRANAGQQGRHVHYSTGNNYSSNYSTQYRKPQKHVAPNKYATLPQYRSSTPSYNTSNISNTNSYYNREPITNIANVSLPSKTAVAATSMITPDDTSALHLNNSTLAADLPRDEATIMLSESIGKINMGNKMNNFMAEAGKIISNMLEARLANSGSDSMSKSDSTLSLRSNSSSNLSRSPMVLRKRLDLDDFKDVDPTQPVSLQPVIAVQQHVTLNPNSGGQKAQPQVPLANSTLTRNIPLNHPMGKVINLCDKSLPKEEVTNISNKNSFGSGKSDIDTVLPMNTSSDVSQMPISEAVIYRNNGNSKKSSQRGGEHSTHALDRRSYIELPTDKAYTEVLSDHVREGPVFSINVKCLGPTGNSDTQMSPENEEVVSQLLKDGRRPICCQCNIEITKGPFITALGRIWCPDHFICVNGNCRRPLQDIGFVEEKGDLYCEYCFEKYLAPTCSKCGSKIKGDCLNAIGKHFHPECFTCGHCGKLFGNTPFFLEDGNAYCEADWNELYTTKCFACGFPVEAGDRWVEALNHNYHSQCFNCTYCKQNLEGQSFYNKGGRPFCKNHAR